MQTPMREARNILMLLLAAMLLMQACGKNEREVVAVVVNPDSVPTMVTRDVQSLISDSGLTRYRITTRLWLVFDEAKIPVWKFPIGLYIEKFDTTFKTEAYIKCDSATYFMNDQLWRLDGNVEIRNTKKELFLTEQIFWSQYKHEVYSDSFIHIERQDRIIEGYGFTSNEKMTVYQINRPSGIFPIEERRPGSPADRGEPSDSMQAGQQKKA